jgi:hypothetical protein
MVKTYSWSRLCAWALTAAVAVLGLSGVTAIFIPDGAFLGASLQQWCVISLAAIIVLSVANANNAAAAAMHAISIPGGWRRWHWPTLAPSLVLAAGFAGASNIGVHLGWAILAAAADDQHALPSVWVIDAAALFVSFAKPGMAWIIEGRLAIERAQAQVEQEAQDARIEAARAADRTEGERRAAHSAGVTPVASRGAKFAGAAALALMAAMGTQEAGAQPFPNGLTGNTSERETSKDRSANASERPNTKPRKPPGRREFDNRLRVAQGLLVTQPNLSNRRIAQRSGVSPSTVDRAARMMRPAVKTAPERAQ